MNLYSEHARELLGMPQEWRWYRIQAIGYTQEDPAIKLIRVTGAIAPMKKRGKYKGLPNWKMCDRSTDKTAYFTPTEHDRWVREWENKTGKCADCTGSGKRHVGWSKAEGAKYMPCKKCGETGMAAP